MVRSCWLATCSFRAPFQKRPVRQAPARRRQGQGLWVESLEERYLLSAASALGAPALVATPVHIIQHTQSSAAPLATSGPTGTTPEQIRTAYAFYTISLPREGTLSGASSYNASAGKGQTIAIVDAYDDPTVQTDLQTFDKSFGLPDVTVAKVNENGGTSLPGVDPNKPGTLGWYLYGDWEEEEALDVEWAHAIAPQANIVLVEANGASNSDLYTAVQTAANLAARSGGAVSNASAVSMSWGLTEYANETADDPTFVKSGVTFVAASGDSGAPVIYPAASPNVLAVGGTTLNLTSTNTISSETGWSGSGGGLSAYEPVPGYQPATYSNGTTTGLTPTGRMNPDVAYDADPNTGFPVCDSYDFGSSTPWNQFGGTSDAAPQWSALLAIANQGRAEAGAAALNSDSSSQTAPLIYQLAAKDFHDITSGTSTGSPNYTAGPGYDLVTGRGTPVAGNVVADLIGSVHFSVTPSVTTTVAGNAFNVTVTALDQSGNVDTGYAGSVQLASSDGQAVLNTGSTTYVSLPTDVTLTNGSGVFSVTLKTVGAGSQTITATDTANSGTVGSTTVGVTPAAAALLEVSAPANVTANTAFNITVTAQDPYGNTATGYAGTVAITSSDAQAVLPANSTLTNGAGTFSVTLVNPGTQTVTATDTSTSSITGTASVNVQAAVLTSFSVTPSVTTTVAGNAFNVTVTALDQSGNVDSGYTGTVQLASSDGQAVLNTGSTTYVSLPTDVTLTNGSGVFSVTLKTVGAGSQTITATANGTVTGSTTVSVTPAAASKLVFAALPGSVNPGAPLSVPVQVEDPYGNVVTGDNSDQVTLQLGTSPSGGSTTLNTGTSSQASSVTVTAAKGVATFKVAIDYPGNGYTLAATSGSLTRTTSGPINVVGSLVEGFESGSLTGSGYKSVGVSSYPAKLSQAAAHDGTYGLDTSNSSKGWLVRSGALVKAGDVITAWVKLYSAADGNAYFGFGANSGGTLALVLSPGSNRLLLQNITGSNYGTYTTLASVSQTYSAGVWYRLEVDWGTGTNDLTGKLYDSSGKLLNSVTAQTPTAYKSASGGIAFRSTGHDKYWDTVTDVSGAAPLLVPTPAPAPASAEAAAIPTGAYDPANPDRGFPAQGTSSARASSVAPSGGPSALGLERPSLDAGTLDRLFASVPDRLRDPLAALVNWEAADAVWNDGMEGQPWDSAGSDRV